VLHHASFPVSDLERSARLYDGVLAALGYRRVCSGSGFVGYGVEDGKDKFLIAARPDARCAGPGFHLALAAPDRRSVDRFHRAALELGASSNGAPGLREHYGPDYYAAFIVDPDGHHIEAVFNGPDGSHPPSR